GDSAGVGGPCACGDLGGDGLWAAATTDGGDDGGGAVDRPRFTGGRRHPCGTGRPVGRLHVEQLCIGGVQPADLDDLEHFPGQRFEGAGVVATDVDVGSRRVQGSGGRCTVDGQVCPDGRDCRLVGGIVEVDASG